MLLEESPEAFYQRFADCRVSLLALPVPVGYPLIEFETPFGLLRAMDRGIPPAPSGTVEVVIHGVLHRAGRTEGRPGATALPGGRYRLNGRVEKLDGAGWYCLRVPVPVVIFSPIALPADTGIWVETEPPLFAFRP